MSSDKVLMLLAALYFLGTTGWLPGGLLWIGAAVMLVPLLMSLGLPPVPQAAPAAER